MNSLIITQPDDWHVHFRDGEFLPYTVAATAASFARALVMPNLQPALTELSDLLDYHQRILAAIPKKDAAFTPYMTFYLNEKLKPETLEQAKSYPLILGAKLYPAGATTHSAEGVRSIKTLYPLLELMQAQGLTLQIHGEVTHGDIFDREEAFIQEHLRAIVHNFPKLRIVLEHISSAAAVNFVMNTPDQVVATITPQHLLYNRNQLLAGGIRPHYYCLPILKTASDQRALQTAACSGNPKFFAGTDSAPHARQTKENACGCAGIYSAPYAVALYTQVFAQLDQLRRLNDFLSRFGAEFYGLSVNRKQIELRKYAQQIPATLPFGTDEVVPIAAGESIDWSSYECS
ncbi:MAG: dihydroorotase [Legionella sp.]|nr:dihydroorotase [Legionella sp.]